MEQASVATIGLCAGRICARGINSLSLGTAEDSARRMHVSARTYVDGFRAGLAET